MDCCMFKSLQNSLNISGVRFVPVLDTVFLGSPNSSKVILATCTRSSAERPTTFFTTGSLL